ncbi:MAG: 4-hydroxybenzoate polyprenyltransferase [Bradymonadia bacterium]|jgi:4-hydroxybenzoate polyprenyltransferase
MTSRREVRNQIKNASPPPGGLARPFFELIRLPAVFTAPSDVLAGMALASLAIGESGGHPFYLQGLAILLASACVYCAGMAANDIFDAKIDAEERPGRPIPSGRVPLQTAWALVIFLQLTGLMLAGLSGLPTVAAVALTILLTYVYNAATKDTILGPFVMGACRWANAAVGMSVIGWPGEHYSAWYWLIPSSTMFYVAALTFVSRHEVDGATARALRWPTEALLLGAVLPLFWALFVLPVWWAAFAVVVPFFWLVRPIRKALATPNAGAVRGVVMAGIFGIAMVNACIALAAGGYIFALIAVLLLIPGKFVGRWFYAT